MRVTIGRPKSVHQDGQRQTLQTPGDMIIEPSASGVPEIDLDYKEVDRVSGSGGKFDAVQITAIGQDGKTGRFWVDVHFDHQGKPVCTVATNKGGSSKSTKIRGEWR